jgi:hypothetical protein
VPLKLHLGQPAVGSLVATASHGIGTVRTSRGVAPTLGMVVLARWPKPLLAADAS